MKIRFRILPLIALVLFVSSCCPCRSYQKKTRRPLVGTQWQLIQVAGRNMLPESETFTIRFDPEQQRISGVAACNRLVGKFATDNARTLTISGIALTRIACPTAAQEQEFIEVLQATTHYDMDGPMLMLLSNGELRALLQAK